MDAKLQLMLTARDMTASSFAGFQRRIQSTTRILTSFTGVIGGLAGIGGVGGMALMTKRTLDFSDAMAKQADVVGMSTDAWRQWMYVGERSSITQDKMRTNLEQFTKRIGELRAGQGALYTYLSKTDEAFLAQLSAVRSNDEAMDLFMRRLAGVADANDRAALASAGFGRAGLEMNRIVRGGIADLEAVRNRFQDLGLTIDESLLRGAEGANDAITDLTWVLDTSFKSAVLTLAPDIQHIATEMANWVGRNKELITQDLPAHIKEIAAAVRDPLGTALRKVKKDSSEFWDYTQERIRKLKNPLETLADDFRNFHNIASGKGTLYDPRPVVPGEMSEHEMRRLGLSVPPQLKAPPPSTVGGARAWTADDQLMEDLGLNDLAWFEQEQERRLNEILRNHEQAIRDTDRALSDFFDSYDSHMQGYRDLSVDMGLNDFFGDIDKAYDDLINKTEEKNNALLDLNKRTAWAMQGTFSDLFFDALQGEMKSFEDYFSGFMRTLNRIFSEYMAQMLMQKAFGEAAGGSGGGWVGMLVNLVGTLASRDSGGPVRPGRMYEIGVPEMLHVGNKSYLMMGGNQGGYAQPLRTDGSALQQTPEMHLHNINVLDPSIVESYLNTPSGETAVLNIIRRNE